jgi:hypothetical protein
LHPDTAQACTNHIQVDCLAPAVRGVQANRLVVGFAEEAIPDGLPQLFHGQANIEVQDVFPAVYLPT